MILDTSAVVAILAGEPDAAHYAELIERDPTPRIGTPALFEASIVLTRWFDALAHVCDEALLFKGEHFTRTDIQPAGSPA